MTFTKLSLVALVALAVPVSAGAQIQGQVQWEDAGSAFSSSFRKNNGTDVRGVLAGAAYNAKLKINSNLPYLPPHSATAFGPTVDIYCIDFLHTANTAAAGYTANFTNLAFDAPLTKTRSSSLAQYLKAAYLITQMDAQAMDNAGRINRVDIHGAIWRIMAGEPRMAALGNTSTFDLNAAVRLDNWITLANANYSSVNAEGWTVITSTCVDNLNHEGAGSAIADNCGQEFLTRSPVVTPEPETILLLATGMLIVLGAGFASRPV